MAIARVNNKVLDRQTLQLIRGDQRYNNLADKTFRISYPLIEQNSFSCVLKLQDVDNGELFAGKIILSAASAYRDCATRQRRHDCLRMCAAQNFKFAPEGVCIGLRPILIANSDTISCGELTDSNNLDVRFEYIWLMHLLKAGESIGEKLQRNLAILQPLAQAIHTIHGRADKISDQEAWSVARPEKVQQKFYMNLDFFDLMLAELRKVVPATNWTELWPESCGMQLTSLAKRIGTEDTYRSCFDRRIKQGNILRGHGDIKIKNIWFSDYHRSDFIRRFKDCLTFIDAIDFDDRFSTIDTLSEAAMLIVDIQHRTSPFDTAHFVHYYLKYMPEWQAADGLVLEYYLLEKALVGMGMAVLDHEYQSALKFLWIARMNLRRLVAHEALLVLK